MKIRQLFILGVFVIFSCSTRDTRTIENAQLQDTVDNNTGNKAPQIKTDTLFLSNIITHYFSSPSIKDTFKLKLTGENIIDGKVEFEIRAKNGTVVHHEVFPANYLIGYGLDQKASESEKIDFIKSRILSFFDKENFNQPAISKEEPFEEDFSDKEIWFDIKSDSTAVTFNYLLGEEGFNRIAYSKKLKKTVAIFGCC